MFEIASAASGDHEAIRRLQCLCPYPDLAPSGELVRFVARSDSRVVGYGCVETLSGMALVRSLAVLPGYRKRGIGRQLLLRLIAQSVNSDARDIYAPGLYAETYFSRFGFSPCMPGNLPPVLQNHPFPGLERLTGRLLCRSLQPSETGNRSQVAAIAQAHFDGGLFCAESVLAAVAEHLDIQSPLIPGIATGFCNGIAGTCGTCGAISGGVLAINLIHGRQASGTSVDKNYQAVRYLMQEFQCRHGSTRCSELIACDLDSKEGRNVYRTTGLREQCRDYVGTAATLSLDIIREMQPKD